MPYDLIMIKFILKNTEKITLNVKFEHKRWLIPLSLWFIWARQ